MAREGLTAEVSLTKTQSSGEGRAGGMQGAARRPVCPGYSELAKRTRSWRQRGDLGSSMGSRWVIVRTWTHAYPEGYGGALEGLRGVTRLEQTHSGCSVETMLQRDRAATGDQLEDSLSKPGERPGSLGQGPERRLIFGVLKVEVVRAVYR